MANDHRVGATLQEWQWAAYHLGPDLLPAFVGDINTYPVSPRMQPHVDKGTAYPLAKLPSKLYSDGVVRGVSQWTSFTATREDVAQWEKEPDLNILVQTRKARAIDIDIEDTASADQIEQIVCQTLGTALPVRYRQGTGKRTLLLRIDPNPYISKRVVNTNAGAVEFLANGQQTALFGTHPNGQRFLHRGFEQGIPTVKLERVTALWDQLRAIYDGKSKPLIVDGEAAGEYTSRVANQGKPDPVLDYLHEAGMVLGYEPSGVVNIKCPNEAEHGEKSSENATSWFQAGIGGVAQGGFKCLHAHCQHINTPLFLDLCGFTAKEEQENFSVGVLPNPEHEALNSLNIVASAKIENMDNMVSVLTDVACKLDPNRLRLKMVKNKPAQTVTNLGAVLSKNTGLVRFMNDAFTGEDYMAVGEGETVYRVTDNIISAVRMAVENILAYTPGYEEVSRQISLRAEMYQFDSARDKVMALPAWDGVSRLREFATEILKAQHTQYGEALGEYLFAALVGRTISPGVKADISPVLISPEQGTGKSSLVEALPLDPSWHGTVDFGMDDDNIFRAIRGKIAIEIPELKGLTGRDAETTKALLSQNIDRWTPKYREKNIEVPRRAMFIGTHNKRRFLTDPTGGRRWAPINVAVTDKFIDHPRYVRERDQYWAEALHMLQKFKSPLDAIEHYSVRLRKLATPYILEAQVLDPWHKNVQQFMMQQRPGTLVHIEAIFGHLFNSGLSSMDMSKVWRIRNIMVTQRYRECDTDTWVAEFIL